MKIIELQTYHEDIYYRIVVCEPEGCANLIRKVVLLIRKSTLEMGSNFTQFKCCFLQERTEILVMVTV